MGTYLDEILDSHRAGAQRDSRALNSLVADALAMAPCRGFRSALTGREQLGVISEIKRRSPSKGDLNSSLDPAALAAQYEAGGASCVSVLTDVDFFGGSVADLQAARAACSLPLIRKDFTVSALDVVDTRLIGADCVLLIAAALDPSELAEYHALAVEIGLDVLVEIHDETELGHALAAKATLIGVNQRDLVTFQVDHERAVRMAGVIPDTAIRVAESGVRGREDALSLRAAGYHAVLVGETLITAADPVAALSELIV